jgi:hypothetical protein
VSVFSGSIDLVEQEALLALEPSLEGLSALCQNLLANDEALSGKYVKSEVGPH